MWRLIYNEKLGLYLAGVSWGAVVREGMVLKGSDFMRFLFYKDDSGSSIARCRNWAWRKGDQLGG